MGICLGSTAVRGLFPMRPSPTWFASLKRPGKPRKVSRCRISPIGLSPKSQRRTETIAIGPVDYRRRLWISLIRNEGAPMKIKQLDGLVDELLFSTRVLFQELGDPWGHIAVLLPKGDGRDGFLLKHVRVTPPPGDPDAVMMFDYNGKLLEGERRVPWELPLFTAIFKTRP